MFYVDAKSMQICIGFLICFIFSSSSFAINSNCEEHFKTDIENLMKVGAKGILSGDFVTFSAVKPKIGFTPHFGFGVFFEYPLLDLFFLGTQFDTKFEPQGELTQIDLNAFFKLPLVLGFNKYFSNFYLLAPLGFSFGWFSSKEVKLQSNPKGFNLGALMGKEFSITESFKVLVESGYRYRYMAGKDSKTKGISLSFHEVALNIGVAFAF